MEELHKGTQLHEDGAADRLKIDWQMPQLCTKQAVRTLRKLGVKLVTCNREADALLPSILRRTPGAYAGKPSSAEAVRLACARKPRRVVGAW